MNQSRREILDALTGRIDFELDGRRFTVPAHPLRVWLQTNLEPYPDAIIPGLLAESDSRYLYERLLEEDEPLDVGICESIGLWVLEQLAGRPWWEVQRGLAWGLDSWNTFDAWYRQAGGGDLLELSVRSFLNVFVRFAIQANGEEAESWVAGFSAPPLGTAEDMEHRPEWAEEEVEADFSSAFGDFAAISAAAIPT